MKQKIENALNKLNIKYSEDQVKLLSEYHDFLLKRNEILRLISETSSEAVLFHIFDSLSAVSYLKKLDFESVADIGSGGGLPGIPLAIMFPNARFLLIEKSNRRAGFLRSCIASLGLADRVEIVEDELKNIKQIVDGAVFRAFRQIDEFFLQIAEIIKEGGFVFAYKGKIQETQKELDQLKTLPFFQDNFQSNAFEIKNHFSEASRSFAIVTKK